MPIKTNNQLMPESDKRLLLELFQSRTFIVLLNHLANKHSMMVVSGANLVTSRDDVDREDAEEHFKAARRCGDAIEALQEMAKDDYDFQTSTFETEPITIEVKPV